MLPPVMASTPRTARYFASLRPTGHRLPSLLGIAVLLVMGSSAIAVAKAPTGKKKAAIISVSARTSLDKGEYEMAAKLYDSAYEADPATLGYLYSAARARQRADKLDQAEAGYKQFLKKAGPELAPLREKAKRRLVEIESTRKERALKTQLAKAEKARKDAEAREAKRKAAPKPPQTDLVALGAVGGGGAALVAGTVVLLMGEADWSEASKSIPNADGSPKKGQTKVLSPAKADQAAASVQKTRIIGGALMGVGLAGIGFGVYRMMNTSEPAKVSFAPTAAALQLRF